MNSTVSNEGVPVELKIQVERAVRPVAASWSRKSQMREELLAHICDIYNDELSQGKEPEQAIGAATQRFGDTGALTVELQQSTPAWQRWAFANTIFSKLGKRFGRQPEETQDRYEWRLLLTFTPVYLILVAVLIGGVRFLFATRPLGPVEIRFLFALAVPSLVGGFLLWRIHARLRSLFCRRLSKHDLDWHKISGYTALISTIVVAAPVLFWQLQYWGAEGWLLFQNQLTTTVIAAIAIPAIIVLIASLSARDALRFEEWGYLSIDE